MHAVGAKTLIVGRDNNPSEIEEVSESLHIVVGLW